MVEWALIAPLLILSIFAMCQWCVIEMAHTLTFDAAQKAARAALVGEDAFDAAGVTLLPIAGWNPAADLRATHGSSGVEISLITNLANHEQNALKMPGWTRMPGARVIIESGDRKPFCPSIFLYNRLSVETEVDWDKATADVRFYHELLFPFVDILFADMRTKKNAIAGESQAGEDEDVGISKADDISSQNYEELRALNFVELRARASVPQIGRPSASVTYGDWDGIEENPGEQLIERADEIVWSSK